MNLTEITSVKKPIILIMGILNPVAVEIINLLSTQDSNVILTDLRQGGISEVIKRIPNYGKSVFFLEYTSLKRSAFTGIKRLNYILHFLYHIIVGSNYPFDLNPKRLDISHQLYLQHAETIDFLQSLAIEKDARYQLILPAFLLQLNKLPGQFNIELFKHSQLVTQTNMQAHNLKARIIKIGEPIGNTNDLSVDSIPRYILKHINRKKLIIPGDGLTTLFFSPTQHTAQLLTLSMLTAKRKTQPILMHHSNTPSVLSFIHLVNEVTEKDFKFTFQQTPEYSEVLNHKEELFKLQTGLPLQEIGLDYPAPLENTIMASIQAIYTKDKPNAPQPNIAPPPKPKKQTRISIKRILTTILTTKILPSLNLVYRMLIQASFNPLTEEQVQLMPLFFFLLKALLTMLLAAISTPILIIGLNYYRLKALIQQIRTSPPQTAHAVQQTITSLQEYHSITNISVPKQLLAIPQIQEFQTMNQKTATIIKLLDSYSTILTPIDNYIQTHDPEAIRPLVLKAAINPTYTSELWISLNEYQEQTNFMVISETIRDLIQSLPTIYPILPALTGYTTPLRIEIVHITSNTSSTVYAKDLVFSRTPVPDTHYYIRFFIPQSVFKYVPSLQSRGSATELINAIPHLPREEVIRLIINFSEAIHNKRIRIETNQPELINYFGL